MNVGAGTGAYEPTDREVVAVEPSPTMIAQRPPTAAPVLEARAEQLPFADQSFDAALAVNTVQHWSEVEAGLRELRRVARRRVVIFLRNPSSGTRFWLSDYVPALERTEKMAGVVVTIERELAPVRAVRVPLPRECADGLFSAFWARPEMYLDEEVRRNISNFALAPKDYVARGVARLDADLRSGEWDRRYGHLRSQSELDLGHRLLVATRV